MDLFCKNGNEHRSLKRKNACTICNAKQTKQLQKETCQKCGKLVKNIKYHRCSINFNSYEQDAWLGDAEHRCEVIKMLIKKGHKRDVSNTLLTEYVSATAQCNYLLSEKIITLEDTEIYSEHKLSCIFEAMFINNFIFKKRYLEELDKKIQIN